MWDHVFSCKTSGGTQAFFRVKREFEVNKFASDVMAAVLSGDWNDLGDSVL